MIKWTPFFFFWLLPSHITDARAGLAMTDGGGIVKQASYLSSKRRVKMISFGGRKTVLNGTDVSAYSRGMMIPYIYTRAKSETSDENKTRHDAKLIGLLLPAWIFSPLAKIRNPSV